MLISSLSAWKQFSISIEETDLPYKCILSWPKSDPKIEI